MKQFKLFPKTFLYTLGLMLFVVAVAHSLMYLLAPKMQLELTTTDNIADILSISVAEETIVMQAVQKALPFSIVCCLLISIACSLLFSRAIAGPVKRISSSTEQMKKLDRTAQCQIHSKDEIGALAHNINDLYSNLLSTIEYLEEEKNRGSETERSKADFLRAASHELKTPITALNVTLENMILGIGKYRDYDTYLPECKEMAEQVSEMIHEILETSKLNMSVEQEEPVETNVSELLTELCGPYQLIAAAHQIHFSLDLPECFPVTLPANQFSKAVSNILANAVAYTKPYKTVSIYLDGHSLVVENECVPIPQDEISRLFEPFYRPDFSRSRESGGNGLGLYIVETLLSTMKFPYSFVPMESPGGMRFTIFL